MFPRSVCFCVTVCETDISGCRPNVPADWQSPRLTLRPPPQGLDLGHIHVSLPESQDVLLTCAGLWGPALALWARRGRVGAEMDSSPPGLPRLTESRAPSPDPPALLGGTWALAEEPALCPEQPAHLQSGLSANTSPLTGALRGEWPEEGHHSTVPHTWHPALAQGVRGLGHWWFLEASPGEKTERAT